MDPPIKSGVTSCAGAIEGHTSRRERTLSYQTIRVVVTSTVSGSGHCCEFPQIM